MKTAEPKIPISLAVQSARLELISATNQIATKYKLPASLLDGIMSSVLADVRSQEFAEILRAANSESEKEMTKNE